MDDMDSARGRHGATPAQLAANRRNASHSTGPRSAKGKARSAENAVKHGIFGDVKPIRKGAFREDPEEVGAFVDAVVMSLAPADSVEHAIVNQIARILLQLRRLGRYEDATLNDAGRSRGGAELIEGVPRDELQMVRKANAVEQLSAWAAEYGSLEWIVDNGKFVDSDKFTDEWRYDSMSEALIEFRADLPRVRDLYDATHKPTSDDDWRALFRTWVHNCSPRRQICSGGRTPC